MHVDLTVATFNIRNGLAWDGRNSWPLRRRATAKALAALDADIVGLQEVYGFQRRYLLGRVPGYRAVGKGRRNGRRGEQCPILVRDPVAIDADWTRWFGDEPEHPGSRLPGASFPRIATMATCHRADGTMRRRSTSSTSTSTSTWATTACAASSCSRDGSTAPVRRC
ncbi:MAG: endonuclease/exonuclease/phosphatase family protein [Ilumatobacteraceae bacterium]